MYRTDIAAENELRHWDQIVSRCPHSEALHTIEWRNALAACFKQLEPLYYVIRDDTDSLVGALPCFLFHPIPPSRMLSSMPWTLPGGPLVFPGANAAAVSLSVAEKLDEVSHDRHSFEITLNLPPRCDPDVGSSLASFGYTREPVRFTHILETGAGYDEIWKAYNKRVRGAVRKAKKTRVAVKETVDEAAMMDFYRLYLASMAHFSSTPKPYQLLRSLQTSTIARLVVAELDNQVIAGLLFLHFNSSVRLWCEASDPNFLSYRPNNAIIDYIIRWACEHGYSCVDFGASPEESTGLIAFKEEWRAQKVCFHTFTRLHSPWRKKMWVVCEPALRRLYGMVQRFRIRGV